MSRKSALQNDFVPLKVFIQAEAACVSIQGPHPSKDASSQTCLPGNQIGQSRLQPISCLHHSCSLLLANPGIDVFIALVRHPVMALDVQIQILQSSILQSILCIKKGARNSCGASFKSAESGAHLERPLDFRELGQALRHKRPSNACFKGCRPLN